MSDRWEQPELPIDDEEARRLFEKLLAEAEKRGGTPKGRIVVELVDGRRLS